MLLQSTLHKKMKFPITDFFSKCDQICRKLRTWSHLLKKSVMVKTSFFLWNHKSNTSVVVFLMFSRVFFIETQTHLLSRMKILGITLLYLRCREAVVKPLRLSTVAVNGKEILWKPQEQHLQQSIKRSNFKQHSSS